MSCILLDYPGVKGDSKVQHYKNLIVCENFDMRSGKRDIGGHEYDDDINDFDLGGDYGAASLARSPSIALKKDKRNLGVDNLELIRRLDIASPKLMQAAFSDPVKDLTATLHFFRAAPGDPMASAVSGDDTFYQPYMTLVLKNTQITQYDLTIDGVTGASSETIALAFDELSMTFIHYIESKKVGQIRGDIKMASKK